MLNNKNKNMRLFKCCTVEGDSNITSIKIKSSCFEKPLLLNLSSDDEDYNMIKDMLIKILEIKKKKESNVNSSRNSVNSLNTEVGNIIEDSI